MTDPQPTRQTDVLLKGVGLKLLSTLSFSAMVVCVKTVTSEVESSLTVLGRGVVMVAVLIPWMRWQNIPLLGKHRLLLHLRCLFGAGALHCLYYSFKHAPLAETVVLANMAPLYVPILGALFLGERSSWSLVGLQLLGFFGVVVVAGPKLQEFEVGTITAAVCGFLVACGLIPLKKLTSREHTLTIVLYFAMWTMLSPLVLPWTWEADWSAVPGNWILFLLIGLFSIGGQGLLTRALAYAPANLIVLLNYFGTVLNFVIGWWIWNEVPSTRTFVGAFMIVTACILTTHYRKRLVTTS